jgi:hypothetical protein
VAQRIRRTARKMKPIRDRKHQGQMQREHLPSAAPGSREGGDGQGEVMHPMHGDDSRQVEPLE